MNVVFRRARIVSLLVACGVIGGTLFAAMAWRATSTEVVEGTDAMRRFDALRAQFGPGAAILVLERDGTVINRAPAPVENTAGPLSRIVVFVYRPDSHRLIETRIPFWFFRIKAPAADYALDGTGLSFQKLGVTADELWRYGPRVVLDHRTEGGGRLLIWTE